MHTTTTDTICEIIPEGKAARTATSAISVELAELRANALTKWRSWAADLAAGKDSPNARDVLDAAQVLAIADPGKALDTDAKVLRDIRAIEERAAAQIAQREATLKPHGGERGIAAKIAKLREEVRALEQIASGWGAMAAGFGAANAVRLKRQNPRLFADLD